MRIRNCRNGNFRWYLKALKKKDKKKEEILSGLPELAPVVCASFETNRCALFIKLVKGGAEKRHKVWPCIRFLFYPGKERSTRIRWPENTSAAQYCSKMKVPGSVAHRGRTRRTPFSGISRRTRGLTQRPDARANSPKPVSARKSAPSASERVLRRLGRRSLAETN